MKYGEAQCSVLLGELLFATTTTTRLRTRLATRSPFLTTLVCSINRLTVDPSVPLTQPHFQFLDCRHLVRLDHTGVSAPYRTFSAASGESEAGPREKPDS